MGCPSQARCPNACTKSITLTRLGPFDRHAVFPMGFLLCAPLAGQPESGLPAMPGAVATVLLQLPLLKHLLAALGSVPAGAHPPVPVLAVLQLRG